LTIDGVNCVPFTPSKETIMQSNPQTNSEVTSRPRRIVIVGGGFGGINTAKKLADREGVDVTLIDRRNYHLFQPLLYQVAMAGLNPGEIATPIRSIFAGRTNIRALMGEVRGVDLSQKLVNTDFGPVPFDSLILACGAQHSYFGHEEWEPFAPGMKTLEQATEIRRRVLTAFELAERANDPELERRLLTFVIVGGGPTGVELAGTLGEISRFALSKDFRHIDPTKTRVILIEAGSRILATFDEKLSKRARRDLENLGVTIWTGMRVTNISADGVTLGEEKVHASTVLWAAGVKPSPLNATLGVPLDKAGRVIVNPDLSLPGHPDVFVIGDQACFIEDQHALPGLAPVAMQQGRRVAANILRDIAGKPRENFHYFDKGQMATIGRGRAVAQTKSLRFGGLMAWLAWLLVHIYYLVGFRNRVMVLLEWAWAYMTYRRGAQLITHREWRSFLDSPVPLADTRP
jgi:NADH:ubiquinone reductase (H+-translocating)